MSIPQNLMSALELASNSLMSDSEGALGLSIRRKIWNEMGPYQFDEDGFAEGVGNLRRTELSRLCAQKVMEIWKENFPNDNFPEKMISQTELYLDGEIDSVQLWEGVDEFNEKLDHNENPAVAAGYAAMQVPYTALNDLLMIDEETEKELPEDLQDEELDYLDHDSGYFASLAVVLKNSNDDYEALENRRGFWRWYLSEAVPSAYAAYDEEIITDSNQIQQ